METPAGRARGILAVLLGLGACDGTPPPPPDPGDGSLVELEAWEYVREAGEDVFGAERPAGHICDEILGIGREMFGPEQVLEISTDFCDYATVRQPTLRPLLAGDTVAIRAWHYELTTPPPAEAHLAVALDGALVWETFVASPAEGDFVEGQFVVEGDLPVGTELQFHVHNHGPNSYDLLSIERRASDTDGGTSG